MSRSSIPYCGKCRNKGWYANPEDEHCQLYCRCYFGERLFERNRDKDARRIWRQSR